MSSSSASHQCQAGLGDAVQKWSRDVLLAAAEEGIPVEISFRSPPLRCPAIRRLAHDCVPA